MPGLSYDIDKLLREIQGVGQHRDPRFGTGERVSSNLTQLRYPTTYIDNYEAPRDAFDQALLDEPEEATGRPDNSHRQRRPPFAERYQHGSRCVDDNPETRLRVRGEDGQPYQTPPQLLAEPSSPVHPPISSPLAGIIQKREAQASGNAFPLSQSAKVQEYTSSTRLSEMPPIVQGVRLVSPNELPDRFRSVFPFPLFNAVQSKCYETAYKTSDNLVLSAPTGSGKTVILELAVCHLMSEFGMDQFKIVYMAPTKSLCAERQKDWQAKFSVLQLQCAELTGDTNQGQLRNVQNASIIITTPEKWDSMTRKWKDHAKLMQLVKLFLIDEVHILKETRGACLEAVVSRMKSIGSDVRFLALSATVPNPEDIATWLGRNSMARHLPAHQEIFGEEFRPVKLQKYVYGIQFNGNDWGFDRICDPKLPEIIAKHSHKKPIMVFCATRKSTVSTAKLLTNWWLTTGPQERQWAGPTFRLAVQDADLKDSLTAGVAFHHAGLDASDRQAIEKGFMEGQVNVICCTSTLAVGVNLPCHMVIIKNTMGFQDEGLKEYSDLEVMQMLGRAGRPQFEDSAVAVIITKQEKLQKYERMVAGQELLESSLHLNLIEHLNAEMGLGTIYNLHTAKRWLSGTFLCVRLGRNPLHYRLDGDAAGLDLDDRVERICRRDIDLLREAQLVTNVADKIKCTEFGDAMARYYVQFETMKCLLNLEPRSKMSDILSILVGAEEFHDIRYRATEKKLLKDINGANGVKYPIKVDIALSQHKRSLIIQAELGGVDFPADEQYTKFSRQFQQDKNIIFNHIHRLIRCVIDCQVYLQDAVTVRHALELARSFAARVWDNSPYQMKQVPNIGPAAVRRLANGGINSIESLEAAEPHRIEMLMSKHPPFGTRILASLKDYPKLRVSIKMMGKDVKAGQAVKIKIKAELGFINEKPPAFFCRKAVYICFVAERSDGHLIDFRRMSAGKLQKDENILLSVELLQHTQHVTCYVMCDEIGRRPTRCPDHRNAYGILAGTMRYAELKPNLPPSMFPTLPLADNSHREAAQAFTSNKNSSIASSSTIQGDERLYDDGVADEELFEAATRLDFNSIDTFESDPEPKATQKHIRNRPGTSLIASNDQHWAPTQLANGKWACNHICKDKTACKHICCREGVDRPQKAPRKATTAASSLNIPRPQPDSKADLKQRSVQTKLQIGKPALIKDMKDVETVDLAHARTDNEYVKVAPRAYRSLHQLHKKVNKDCQIPAIAMTKPSFSYKEGDQPKFSFFSNTGSGPARCSDSSSNDYGTGWMDDLPSPSAFLQADNQTDGDFKATDAFHNELVSEAFDLAAEDFGLDFVEGSKKQSRTSEGAEEPMESTIFADDRYDEAVGILGSEALPEASPNLTDNRTDYTSKMTKEQKLFLSTDSPEKPSSPPVKRKYAEFFWDEPNEETCMHEEKREKILDTAIRSVQPSPPAEVPEACVPNIKPGYPDWVYEFDPAFVAEWEPYVEFV